jgi:hypothetical protein
MTFAAYGAKSWLKFAADGRIVTNEQRCPSPTVFVSLRGALASAHATHYAFAVAGTVAYVATWKTLP